MNSIQQGKADVNDVGLFHRVPHNFQDLIVIVCMAILFLVFLQILFLFCVRSARPVRTIQNLPLVGIWRPQAWNFLFTSPILQRC